MTAGCSGRPWTWPTSPPARSRATPPPANGSSLALLAEHDGHRCLLAGDAFADEVLKSVTLLAGGDDLFEVDALKLSHHGGRKNTSAELIQALACRNYLFSTNGTIYKHPQVESVARVVKFGREAGVPRLHFNHRCDQTLKWDKPRPPPSSAELRTDLPGTGQERLAGETRLTQHGQEGGWGRRAGRQGEVGRAGRAGGRSGGSATSGGPNGGRGHRAEGRSRT